MSYSTQSYKRILVHMYTMSVLISMYHMHCILNAFEALTKNSNEFILKGNFRKKKSLTEISWNFLRIKIITIINAKLS